jgi:dCTP deaminase
MAGVFPSQWIRKAIEAKQIRSRFALPDEKENQLQPASLDLRLGEKAYRLRCSFLPGDETVTDKVARYAMGTALDLRDGAILERNVPYLIPLEEELALPADVRAKANPKSSIGRLDVFTRVITDRGPRFDEISSGYEGKLYLEVFSRTFTIKISSGQSLNQLRLSEGRSSVSDEEISKRSDEIVVSQASRSGVRELSFSNGLFLSLDLRGDDTGLVGYRARRNSELLDLSQRGLDPELFWEPVRPEKGSSRLVLEPEEFYLLISREAVAIPPDLAAEMTAYDPTSGELRTHYAGFFDPGFGFSDDPARRGARAVLEVRAHDVPFVVEDGQRICTLAFERMRDEPEILYGDVIGSNYQAQTSYLSKYFLPPKTIGGRG